MVELVGSDRLLFARVVTGVTTFLKKRPNPPPPFWPEILEQKPVKKSSFPPEFLFFRPRKSQFLGGYALKTS